MLRRYHIIALDDLRTAAAKGSVYGNGAGSVATLAEARTRRVGPRERAWLS
jgi:hypothetical protein